MLRSHRDHTGVPPLGPQDVGSREDPGVRQQGPGAKPTVFWDTGQILHAEQNLPGEQAGLGSTTSHNPFHLKRESARRTAAGWRDTEKYFSTVRIHKVFSVTQLWFVTWQTVRQSGP